MKKLLITLALGTIAPCFIPLHAQLLKTIGDKAKAKVTQRADKKVDDAMNKGLDGAEAGAKDKPKAKDEKTNEPLEKTATINATPEDEGLKAYSKFDFVPGEKVIAFENFENTAIGDFPERWNTNATAEVVSLNSKPGKWLKVNKEGVWFPEFVTNLPENFTLEFDLGINKGFDASPFVLNIANLEDRDNDYKDFYHYVTWRHGHALHMNFQPYNGRAQGSLHIVAGSDGNHSINNTIEYKSWDNSTSPFAHISLWRQNQRLRVYLNAEKILDLPKAFAADGKYNAVTMAMQGSYRPDDFYVLGNIRLATGKPDTRNKLISEGKFITTGITFDVNADKIKPSSYSILKEIAAVLGENPGVKIKVTGFTDSDGDPAKNIDLSKRRAAAVKTALVSEFAIDASRIETNGLGAANPVAENSSPENKAQNRRVEFVKL
jgi:outer membrane protein OmpA-like peptidoglycan-associated protein